MNWLDQSGRMSIEPTSYPGYRFPAEVIHHAIRLYHVFSLSLRDTEPILAERGMPVSYESIRCWCLLFGTDFAASCCAGRSIGRLGAGWRRGKLSSREGRPLGRSRSTPIAGTTSPSTARRSPTGLSATPACAPVAA